MGILCSFLVKKIMLDEATGAPDKSSTDGDAVQLIGDMRVVLHIAACSSVAT